MFAYFIFGCISVNINVVFTPSAQLFLVSVSLNRYNLISYLPVNVLRNFGSFWWGGKKLYEPDVNNRTAVRGQMF